MASGLNTFNAVDYAPSGSVIDLGQISAATEFSHKIKVIDDKGNKYGVNFQYTIAGITTSLVVRLQGSFDGVNWFNLDDEEQDITQTANGTYSVTYKEGETVFVRFYFVSETGGTAATIDIKAKPF
jgi:hypothetical protein